MEQPLLDAVVADPRQLQMREVYTDWLRDQGRVDAGRFLEVEYAWWRTGERKALVEASRLVWGLDLSWVVSVSVVRRELVELVRRFASRVDADDGLGLDLLERDVVNLDGAHADHDALADVLLDRWGERFAWPLDHWLVTTCLNMTMASSGRSGFFDVLFDRKTVVHTTVEGASPFRELPGFGRWLETGFDGRRCFVGADPTSPYFGAVIALPEAEAWSTSPGWGDCVEFHTLDYWRAMVRVADQAAGAAGDEA
ncbi:MAG: hypothetical protein AAGA48_00875 [Myxococcota bacterium]